MAAREIKPLSRILRKALFQQGEDFIQTAGDFLFPEDLQDLMEVWGIFSARDGDAEDLGAIGDVAFVILRVLGVILVGNREAVGDDDFLHAVPPSILIGPEEHLALEVGKQGCDLLFGVTFLEGKGICEDLLVFILVEEFDEGIDVGEFRIVLSGVFAVFLDVEDLLEVGLVGFDLAEEGGIVFFGVAFDLSEEFLQGGLSDHLFPEVVELILIEEGSV